MLTLGHKVPAVVIALGAGVVVHEDLVQGLQRQIALILLGGGPIGLSPFLGNEGIQDSGLDHLGLDLVAVLDQRHGKGTGILQGIRSELIENLVVFGLLPLEFHGIIGINGLEILNKQGQCALAAAGVANTIEHLAVGLLNGLLCQFLQGHSLGLPNDLLGFGEFSSIIGAALITGRGAFVAAGYQSQRHARSQEQRDQSFLHFIPSSIIFAKFRIENTNPFGCFYCILEVFP